MDKEIVNRQEYYGGMLKRPGSKKSNLSDLDREEISAWKKNVHTNMTSRVLEERQRQQMEMRNSFNSQRHMSDKGPKRSFVQIGGSKPNLLHHQ